MRNYFLIVFGAFVIFSIFITLARADIFKEGKWTMTMVTKMDNMPPEMAAAMKQIDSLPPEMKAKMQAMQGSMGFHMNGDGGMTVTVTQCMTQKNPVPQHIKAGEEQYCQSTHETIGNTINFHTTCNHDDFQMESSGSMTYNGDSMQGHIKTSQVVKGRSMGETVDMTGQYLGPC